MARPDRRTFLGVTASWWAASTLRAQERPPTDEVVRFDPPVEPLVRTIEESSTEQALAALADEVRRGRPERELLEALFLAGLRRNHFDHPVYMVHSASEWRRSLEAGDRLLPLFAVLANFKASQERWPERTLPPFAARLPAVDRVEVEFEAAWKDADRDRAEAATVALVRARGWRATFEALWPRAALCWNFIGHKAIAAASCHRSLEALGATHAEAALRFVVRTLFHEGIHPTSHNLWQQNRARVAALRAKAAPAALLDDRGREAATRELLSTLRAGEPDAALEHASTRLGEGLPDAVVWDAVHLAAAELMVRHRGSSPNGSGLNNRPVHACTAANALHFMARTSTSVDTRRLVLLQALTWVSDFTGIVDRIKQALRPGSITSLEEVEAPADPDDAVAAIFAVLPPRIPGPRDEEVDRSGADRACVLTHALCRREDGAQAFLRHAHRHQPRKTTESHAYKFPIAIFENADQVSPVWRPHLLAASVHFLRGSDAPDSGWVASVREATRGL